MKIELLFQGGARAGERVELPAQELIRIGRHPDNDVVFDIHRDLNVSGHHAEIRKEEDGYYLVDVGSSNGTFLAGQRVERVRLASGQELMFGADGPIVRLRFVDDTDTLPAQEGLADAPAPPRSPGEEAAAAIGPDHRVGARTVAMMIDAAMRQAKDKKSGGLGKSTVFMRSMVNQAVSRSTRRFKVISVLLLVVLAVTVAGFLVLRHHEQVEADAAQQELRQQMARLMEQQRGASSAEKQRLAGELDRLNRKLAQSGAASGTSIVKRNLRAVFLLAVDAKEKGAKGFCTGFAVRKRVLGTNAHCIVALEKFQSMGLNVFVVMNREPERRYRVVRVARHPRYHKPQKSISEDVGAVEVDGDLPVLVQLATGAELREMESGDVMYMYGFPGRLADVASPSATLVQGVIGRVTRLDGSFGKFEENLLIQHSAFTSGGTSGSPIFNAQGRVVAVNTGGYVEPGSLQVLDPNTGRAGNLVVAKQLAGYNFGVRIDTLEGLLADLGG
jgi:S1-C subfamily serine protease